MSIFRTRGFSTVSLGEYTIYKIDFIDRATILSDTSICEWAGSMSNVINRKKACAVAQAFFFKLPIVVLFIPQSHYQIPRYIFK
jgi:hypothetical protein